MLNTEIREYVSQMNQEELKEVEQIIIESKVRKAIEEIATEQQLKCIKTDRNFVINQMERSAGKSFGIILQSLYEFKPCIIKTNNNYQFRELHKKTLEIVDIINKKCGNKVVNIISTRFQKDKLQYFCIQIGNHSRMISDFSEWVSSGYRLIGFSTLYCDDCLPYGINGDFNKIVSYISSTQIEDLLKQCCINNFIEQVK